MRTQLHFFVALLLLNLFTFSSARAQLWYHTHGNTGQNGGLGVTTDGYGNIYTTGYFSGTVNFATTTLVSAGNDIFLAKYSPSGNFLWAKKAGGSSQDAGRGICTDATGIYVAGEVTGAVNIGGTSLIAQGLDILLAKYDSTGSVVWAERFGSWYDDAATSVVSDGAGYLYVTGYFSDVLTIGATTLDAGTNGTDIFIAKFSASDGAPVWAKQLGGTGYDYGNAIHYANGNLYLTGQFQSSMTIGSTTLTSAGSSDVFVAVYDTSDNLIWAKSEGGATTDAGRGISANPSGNVYVSGYYTNNALFGGQNHTAAGNNNASGFLVKYDASGNFVSFTDLKNSGDGYVLPDGAGNVYVAGDAYTVPAYGGTCAALCFAADGNILSVGGYSANQGFDHYIFIAEFAKPTAVASVNTKRLSVYPNPVSPVLIIDGLQGGEAVELRDCIGRVVFHFTAQSSKQTVDMRSASPGVYFLSAAGEQIKVIKD